MLSRRRLLQCAAASVAAAPNLASAAPPGRLVLLQHDFGGAIRSAYLWIPTTVPRGEPAPLVIAMHGAGGDATSSLRAHGWGEALARAGWYGLFPNIDPSADDSDFVLHALAEAQPMITLDAARVFVTGFSRGGHQAYLLAARASERFAAVAPVAASIGRRSDEPRPWSPGTWNAPPLSLLHVHGGDDTRIPLIGDADHVGMWEGLEHWASWLAAPATDPPALPPAPPRVGGRQWVAPTGHEVVGMIDPALAHKWPGWVNDVILAFFARVPARGQLT